MANFETGIVLRFESFELDLRTRELRRDGRLVKTQDLPVKLLALLAGRPGELIEREEIEKQLWGEDHFVDSEHGINTAMRKIREALGEDPESPRFIETLPRKGYRFIAAVQTVGPASEQHSPTAVNAPAPQAAESANSCESSSNAPSDASFDRSTSPSAVHRSEDSLLPQPTARNLFLLIQVGYLSIYCATLYKAEPLQEVLQEVYQATAPWSLPAVLVLAACGIAVRLYLLTSVGLSHPAAGAKYQKLFPALLLLDVVWAASPLLLVRKLGIGLALAAVAALAYLPFVQRVLIRASYRLLPILRGTE